MIDRKALWFAITVIIAMVAATVWRLSLLPDWHKVPLDGPGSKHFGNGLILLAQPFALTMMTAFMYARKWLAAGSCDAMRSWGHWSSKFLVAFCLLEGLMQAFMISRSLGYGLALDRVTTARVSMAAMAVLLLVVGNAMPKLPWLSLRFRLLRLDPWQQNRHLRFQGKLMVGMGLYFLLIAIGLPLLKLLPPNLVLTVMLAPAPLIAAATLWHRAKIRREPSQVSE